VYAAELLLLRQAAEKRKRACRSVHCYPSVPSCTLDVEGRALWSLGTQALGKRMRIVLVFGTECEMPPMTLHRDPLRGKALGKRARIVMSG